MRCGVCGDTGHTSRSVRCPNRAARENQTLAMRQMSRQLAEEDPHLRRRQPRQLQCGVCGSIGHTSMSRECQGASTRPPMLRSAVSTHFLPSLLSHANVVNGRHRLSRMESRCRFCSARMWPEERSTRSTRSFLICCHHGQVSLPPVPPLPQLLQQLTTDRHQDSNLFKKNIRAINANLAFTSAGVCEADITSSPGAPCYVISGELHHLVGSLPPDGDEGRCFAQLYVYDDEQESVARTARLLRVVRDRTLRLPRLLDNLTQEINAVNPYAAVLKPASMRMSERPCEELHVCLLDARPSQRAGTHNLPTSNEIAVILPGSGDRMGAGNRDIILEYKTSRLQRVPYTHSAYNALQYPLMFPYGEDGWRVGIPLNIRAPLADRSINESTQDGAHRPRKNVTLLQYTSYRLMSRDDTRATSWTRQGREDDRLLLGSPQLSEETALPWLQFVVNNYARIEAQRLLFLRFHQKELRAECYRGLCDALDADGSVSYLNAGRRIVLPSSFQGSPRHMHEQYQDAMAIIRRYGKPDLFITMTCNPNWPEILECLEPGQTAANRPEITVRVFQLKLKALLTDLMENHVMGRVIAFVYVIEFQKRGLPHAHILLILHDDDKPRSPDDYDRFVSAEIPDPDIFPELYRTVTTSMMHGPCSNRCLDANGKCKKRFPRPYQAETAESDDGYPLYRRRDNGVFVVRDGTRFTNQHVVPYNPLLAQKYNCHINVEICSSIKSVKYLFKYVHKGHDRINRTLQPEQNAPVDEIERFTTGRYVSQCEAVFRIFQFKLHDRSPAVIRLAVHEEGMHDIILPANTELRTFPTKRTTLLAYFELNARDEFARSLLYHDIPSEYTWNSSSGRWNRRIRHQRSPTIGRMYFVAPTDTERFCLRLLLTYATSYEDLRTVNGCIYETFAAACMAHGFVQDDTEWHACMSEACDVITSGKQLRSLFVTILLYGNVIDPCRLWETFQDKLCEDFVRNGSSNPTQEAIQEIHLDLASCGKTLASFGIRVEIGNQDLEYGFQIPDEPSQLYTYAMMNEDQRRVYEAVHHATTLRATERPHLFYVDGPGGTGKTHLYNTIISGIHENGSNVIVVSSSGISAILLRGGRTAHSMFKIPITNLSADSVCSLSVNSRTARLIRSSVLTVWDEIGMIHRHFVEAVDRLYQDIMRVHDPDLQQIPFGGKVVVFGGDMKQVLPVIPGATRAEITDATLPKSSLWPHLTVMKLTINMRVERLRSRGQDATRMEQFSQLLLRIGAGADTDSDSNITLPADMCILPGNTHKESIQRIVDATFPDFSRKFDNHEYLTQRAILAPTNDVVADINNHLLDMLPGDAHQLRAIDTCIEPDSHASGTFPTEFLNSLNPSGMPMNNLRLKIGMPVLLMRNLRPSVGLCNGVKLIVRSISSRVVTCEIAVGAHAGSTVAIPRIITCPSDTRYPFQFQRLQFPLQPAFALTINKAQGQTLAFVGLFLTSPVFAHGQLYVAMSRVGSPDNIRILTEQNPRGDFTTKNFVYRDALI